MGGKNGKKWRQMKKMEKLEKIEKNMKKYGKTPSLHMKIERFRFIQVHG